MLETDKGKIFASGKRDLSPAQRALKRDGEILAKSPRDHAEVTMLKKAKEIDAKPKRIQVTKKICAGCKEAIEKSGGKLTSKKTAEWDD